MYRSIKQEEIKTDKTLGYQYFIDKEHPLASKGVGKVYYHRHVCSIHGNRWLTTSEVVHHKDGNKLNNSISNLEVLSNSEHTVIHRAENGYIGKQITCPVCSNVLTVSSKDENKRVTCSIACKNKYAVTWNISKSELELLIWNIPYTKISELYGISDVGVKKRAKSLGCMMPPSRFHNKSADAKANLRKENNISDLPTQQSSKLLA